MVHRSIVATLWILAAVALCACAVHRARWIETDLLLRAQTALIDAGIPYHRLTFRGRDAVLGTTVGAETSGSRIAAVVGTVPGVRRVVGAGGAAPVPAPAVAVASPTDRSPAPASEVRQQPAWLRIHRLRDRVVVDGHLPADSCARLLARLRELVGHVEADVDTSTPLEESSWAERAADLADLTAGLDEVRLSIFDHTALLVASAASAPDLARLQHEADSRFPLLAWAFRLRPHEIAASPGPSTPRGTTP